MRLSQGPRALVPAALATPVRLPDAAHLLSPEDCVEVRLSPEVESARADKWVVHMVAAADVVYADLDAAKLWLHARECTQVVSFDSGGTQALGYVRDGFRCVVFRGTQEAEDWLTDMKSFYWNSPPVHFGFQKSWDAVSQKVLAWLKSTSPASDGVYFGGHSLGGAIATIAAYDWNRQGGKVEQVITFGSPCPGSWEFAVRYARAELAGKTKRYKHNQDGVCVIPPPVLFSHVAPPIDLAIPGTANPPAPFPALLPGQGAQTPGLFETLVNLSKPVLMGTAPAAGAVLSMLDEKSESLWLNPKKAALGRWSPGSAQLLFLLLPASAQLIISSSAVAVWLAGHASSILAQAGAAMAWLIGTFLAWVLIAVITLRGKVTSARTAVWAISSLAAAIGMAWGISTSPSVLAASANAAWFSAILAGIFVTQQAAFLLLIRVPKLPRMLLSCVAAFAVTWFSAALPVNGFLTLAVIITGLLTILVYRMAAGVADHLMVYYLLAVTGSGRPTPREQAQQSPDFLRMRVFRDLKKLT